MADKINWLNSSDDARSLASVARKPVLIMFEREDCGGCRAMERTTFNNDAVIDFIGERIIPVKLDIFRDKKDRSDFSAYWTPSFYISDHNGKQFYKFEGYFNAPDFLLKLKSGLMEYFIPRGRYDDGLELFESVSKAEELSPLYPSFTVYKGKIILLKSGRSDIIREILSGIRNADPGSAEARQYFWDI